MVATGSVFDEHWACQVHPLKSLAPIVEPDLRVIVLGDVTAVHDHPGRSYLRGGRDLLSQQFAARNPNPVVAGGNVDDVGRVNVDPNPRRLRLLLEPGGAAWMGELRALPPLRITKEKLHTVSADHSRLTDGVVLSNVSAEYAGEISHPPSLRRWPI
jgi:hypothetical protein